MRDSVDSRLRGNDGRFGGRFGLSGALIVKTRLPGIRTFELYQTRQRCDMLGAQYLGERAFYHGFKKLIVGQDVP